MKRIVGVLLACSTLLFSACSNNEKAESTDATSKQETNASSTNDSQKKEADTAKKQAEEAEKKKQDEISKKVVEADTAMKAAESNPTDETIATAKKAIDAIPGGNDDLKKRLDTATANLNSIKQQAAQAQQQAVQQEQAAQAQQNQVQNDADGNGIPDDSPYNNTTPEERARGAQMEAEANAQWHQGQENIQNGVDPNGNELLPGQDHAAGSNPDGTPDAWVQGQLDRITPDGGYRTDDGIIYPE